MLSKIPFRIAGAAMLGTVALLGTNAANAAINLDADSKRDAAVTYAMETVTESVTGKDGRTYYMVSNAANSMDVSGMVGVGAVSGSVRTMTFTLHDMVFTSTSAPTVVIGASTAVVTDGACQTGGTAASRREGGQAGDNSVSFLVGGISSDTSDVVCLDFANLAVSANGGGVSMKVVDNLPPVAMHEVSYPGAVALEMAVMAESTPMSATALVADQYKTLGQGDDLAAMAAANMGNIMVSGMTEYHDAADDTDVVVADDLYTSVDTTARVGANTETAIAATESTVVFMGDFSLASSVTLDDDAMCVEETDTGTAQTGDLRMPMENDMRDTSRLRTQPLAAVGNNYLCIHVLAKDHRDAMAIDPAGPYKAMITFKGTPTDAKHPPMPMTVELGSIMRDGTNVRIPFITVNERHHQRIVIMNRGGDAFYDMSFMMEEGKTATPGMMASGTLPGGVVTVLSLRNDDVVSVEGGTRTAATLSVEAEEANISVSSVIHSPDTGNTDTVVLQP